MMQSDEDAQISIADKLVSVAGLQLGIKILFEERRKRHTKELRPSDQETIREKRRMISKLWRAIFAELANLPESERSKVVERFTILKNKMERKARRKKK